MKKIAILFVLCLVVALLPTFMPQPVSAMTGSGTAGDPYIIYNVTDLQNMNLDLDAYYILGNDIDASATSGWNGGAGFLPVGDGSNKFTGHFDGNMSKITNLYINRGTQYVGLFGYGSGATITNLILQDVDITGASYHVAGLMAYAYYCTINSTYISGDVDGWSTCGMLVAYASYTTISQCCAYGSDSARINLGGLVGQLALSSTISDCYARVEVYGEDLGFPYITQDIGGLVGSVGGGTIVSNSYSTGLVTNADPGGTHTGGLVGQCGGTCPDSFWDTQTSGRETSDCGTGKATAEMKTQSTFTDADWDFDTVWEMGGYINDGYPYFEWWYNPPDIIADVNQVVWFQPNTIIEGSILPNRAQSGTLQDGEFIWGANPAGITISHGELIPEEEYDFEPVIPGGTDIINPEPETMTGDVDTERLHSNPLYPLVQVLSIAGFLNERLVWLGLAWFILIAAMFGVHLGFDTHKDSEKPQHFVLTTITGLGLSILFYTMGIFPWWVILLMAFGLIGAIIWERQPVL